MTIKTKNIILLSVAAIIFMTVITGYMMWNKPHREIKDTEAIKVTANDLYNIFISDSVKARSSYTDKVVLVSGEVYHVSLNQQAQQIILINTAVNGAFINCTMEGKTTDLKGGDKVIIKGICSGYIGGDADMGLPGDVFLIRGYLFNGN